MLDELRAIAQTGLHYATDPYDRERCTRLLAIATEGYSEALDLPEPEVRSRLARDLGYVSAKVGADAAIFDADGRALLVHRSDDKQWGLVSGWVDPGETPAETVAREVEEEVGLTVTAIELVDAVGRRAGTEYGPHAVVSVLYLCTVAPGPIVINHESLAAEYCEIESIADWHANHESLAYLARDAWRARRGAQSHNGDGADDWDRRYTDGGHTLWSGEPNPALVAETEPLKVGSALDVGCGEGADAIWLAQQGWAVTAVDISAVALDRAREAASSAGVQVDWVCADVPSEQLPAGPFDLVSVMYPAFRHTPDDDAIRAILAAVASGGTLLFVHHSFDGHHGHRPAGFDPADYVQPPDVANHLHDGWTIDMHDERARIRPAGSPGPDVPDVVLRARRTS